jgi:hypothetical protein
MHNIKEIIFMRNSKSENKMIKYIIKNSNIIKYKDTGMLNNKEASDKFLDFLIRHKNTPDSFVPT